MTEVLIPQSDSLQQTVPMPRKAMEAEAAQPVATPDSLAETMATVWEDMSMARSGGSGQELLTLYTNPEDSRDQLVVVPQVDPTSPNSVVMLQDRRGGKFAVHMLARNHGRNARFSTITDYTTRGEEQPKPEEVVTDLQHILETASPIRPHDATDELVGRVATMAVRPHLGQYAEG